ncbi:glutaredoxin domain-containing protein [Rubrivivax albus]|uniref:Glutaredoxin n=1 Tax=Rubrivivax albus TaxID=2499835 RepID=A0A3S2WV08_9BURK|nr:glutaredoxin domain-containing protein [Rubrivivax albus]RVT51678.1 glutaredoxin [Rubrivivax albus]
MDDTRPLLPAARLHPAIRAHVASLHREIVAEVEAACSAHAVVVVGMRGNPFVRRARRRLDAAGVAHHDLDYGGYLTDWRRRNALKLWTGWPTFPMVFVKGVLVGGADDLGRLIDSGELATLLG